MATHVGAWHGSHARVVWGGVVGRASMMMVGHVAGHHALRQAAMPRLCAGGGGTPGGDRASTPERMRMFSHTSMESVGVPLVECGGSESANA